MTEGPARTAALDHLHRGQSNDCYWHGLFGGIYISHMRLATYEHLIAAEDAADRALGTQRVAETRDLDMDGLPEAYLADPGQVVTVTPSSGAGIGSWDVRGRVARARRGPAPTARGLPRDAPRARGEGPRRCCRPADEGGAPSSIHDLVMVKEEGLSRRLFYDDHERRSALVRFLDAGRDARGRGPRRGRRARATSATGRSGSTTSSRARSRCRARGTALGQPLTVTKSIRLGGDRLAPDAGRRGRGPPPRRRADRDPVRARVVAPPAGRRRQPVGLVRRRAASGSAHDGTGEAASVEAIGYGNDWVGVAVEARPTPGRGRLVGADRDRLELGVRLRARLPGQRPAAVVAADARARRVAPVRRGAVGHRRPRPDGGGGRGPGLSAATLHAPAACRPVPATLPR